MALNTNLLANVPQVRLDPAAFDNSDMIARMLQVQQTQNQNALAQYQLGKAKREDELATQRNALFAGAVTPQGNLDYNKLIADAAKSGMGTLIPEIVQGQRTSQEAAAKANKAETELIESRLNLHRGNLAKAQTPQMAAAALKTQASDPLLQKHFGLDHDVDAEVASIPTDPQAFAQWKANELMTASEAVKAWGESNKPVGYAPGTAVYKPGQTTPEFTVPAAPAKPTPSETEELVLRLQDPNLPSASRKVLQDRLRILTTREPKEPKEPSAPIAVVDPTSGQVKYVPREQAVGMTPAAAIEGLTPKERQQREAKFPQATAAVKTFDNTANTLIKDLETLAKHPGLNSITGIAAGRLPGITSQGREAEALFDKIVARGGFQELQNMRQTSPTGGALANVSNREGVQLQQAFAAIDRRQDANSVRKAINDAVQQIRASQQNVREAYDLTYEYRQNRPAGTPAAIAAPAANIDALLNKYK